MNTKTIDTMCMGCFEQLESSDGVCPVCGYNEAAQVFHPHQLRPRTILYGKYLLGKVLGEGGFGITYIGWDLNLDVKVAIKEYYPSGFVLRETTSTNTVQAFTGSQGDFFTKGRERFVDEAKRLAKFRSMPGIVMVNDFFIENGTAYIAMEFVEGQTLKSKLAQTGGKLPAEQVFDMLRPVMTSLAKIHDSGMIHRDISPDNIMIDVEGNVKLLDFGAAREFAKSGGSSMSIMLKPGFAPEEQYRSRGVQGAWTDIYALCATIYRAITGVLPDEALERMQEDTLQPPRVLGAQMTQEQENAILKGLAVHQKDRFQTVMELYKELYGEQQETQYQTEPVSQSTTIDGIDADAQPKPELDPDLTHSGLSVDSDIQPPKDKKTNPIISWFVKNRVMAAIGSVVAVLLIFAVYQMLPRSNDRTDTDENASVTESRDTEDGDNSSTEAIDSASSADHSTTDNNTTDNNAQTILPPSNLTIGQRDVAFGDYTWRVLDIQDGKALLLSEKIIEKRAYINEAVDITWEESNLRKYLNGSFLESFTQEEQDAIIEVTNINDYNPFYGTDSGGATDDKIFLLSIEEVINYFGDSGELDTLDPDTEDPFSLALFLSDQYSEARKAKYEDNWSWWWLRSPGKGGSLVACVFGSGDLLLSGQNSMFATGGVRPALWVSQ
ncbi:MAG: serine/threonine protein kinase [Clostridium sp.]|jgi:serine/threonine protein kinase|nr:serine/threonine protein kinase [Clostridium sp.]